MTTRIPLNARFSEVQWSPPTPPAGEETALPQTWPVLIIAVSQAAASTIPLRIVVQVKTHEGIWIAGSITTTPPSAGDPPERIVAYAYCPGARAWKATFYPTVFDNAQYADVMLAGDRCCASPPGVTKIIHPPL